MYIYICVCVCMCTYMCMCVQETCTRLYNVLHNSSFVAMKYVLVVLQLCIYLTFLWCLFFLRNLTRGLLRSLKKWRKKGVKNIYLLSISLLWTVPFLRSVYKLFLVSYTYLLHGYGFLFIYVYIFCDHVYVDISITKN